MSVKALSIVFEKFPYGGTDYLTIIALADWSDDDGRCFPSVASVGRKIRLSERQARRSMSNLISGGFVKVIGNKYGGVPGETRRYQIVFDSLTGDMRVRPKAETGDMRVRDGGHLGYETGDIGVRQTVIEPSLTVSAKFSKFWSAYPKKKSKGDAEKAFKAINPDSETLEQMLVAIEMQKKTDEWTKNNGKYIKYPATWLRDKAWLDELSVDNNSDLMDGVT
jgi:hypothetical protein